MLREQSYVSVFHQHGRLTAVSNGMKIEEHVPLSRLTTLRVGGEARFLASCTNESDLAAAIRFAKDKTLPFFVLGSGSNVLASDAGYAGVIIRPLFNELSLTQEGDTVIITAGANVLWDDVVRYAAREGLWGIENLAGIPGTVGAAPIQNIGAYGMELAETLLSVDVYDTNANTSTRLPRSACAFQYRDSRFKHEPHLVVLRVALQLIRTGAPRTTYKDLARYAAEHPLGTPQEVGDAVRLIRSRKFPNLATYGTAGSFFKNPLISATDYDALKERYPDLPGFPSQGGVKVPLAWILDNVLALRGFRHKRTWLFNQQPLVVVADTGASAEEVNELAQIVVRRVKEATGIVLEREVRTLPEK